MWLLAQDVHGVRHCPEEGLASGQVGAWDVVLAGPLKARGKERAGLFKSVSLARAGPGREEGSKHHSRWSGKREPCSEKGLEKVRAGTFIMS